MASIGGISFAAPHGVHLWLLLPWHLRCSILMASRCGTPCLGISLAASSWPPSRFPLPRHQPRSTLLPSICGSRCLGISLAASPWHPSVALLSSPALWLSGSPTLTSFPAHLLLQLYSSPTLFGSLAHRRSLALQLTPGSPAL